MVRSARAVAASVVVLLLGATGCGGTQHTGASAAPTSTPSAVATSTAASASSTSPSPRAGLPPSYPLAEVPLADGRVQMGDSGTPDGAGQGWDVYLVRRGTAAQCLAAAGRALLAEGFTRQVVMTNGGVHEAQFTSSKYAVLVSADDDDPPRCTVKYTVGALGR